MKVKIKNEEELVKVAEELIHILTNLRKYTKLWEESYGVVLKTKKKNFEKRADELIERIQAPEHTRRDEINIVIDAN